MSKQAKKTGRPLLTPDTDLIEKLAAIGCPNKEIASIIGISVDTLANRFSDFVDKGRLNGKTRLRKKQIEVAMSGNVTMLIFLGKNMLGQADVAKLDVSVVEGGGIANIPMVTNDEWDKISQSSQSELMQDAIDITEPD